LLGENSDESWFNNYKNEHVNGIRHANHTDMKGSSFNCIGVPYNGTCQQFPLGYRPPIRFPENWPNEQQQKKLATWNPQFRRQIRF